MKDRVTFIMDVTEMTINRVIEDINRGDYKQARKDYEIVGFEIEELDNALKDKITSIDYDD